MGEQQQSHLVRNVGIAAIVVTLLLGVAVVVVYESRDSWELRNKQQVSAMLEEADRLQESDPLNACTLYDEVLNEAKQHRIRDEEFARKLASAEESRTVAYQRVLDRQRAEEAEMQRLAEAERRAAAAEKQRLAEEEERRRATGRWRINRNKSPIDDTETITISLEADESISGWPRRTVPRLCIQWHEGKLACYIYTGMSAQPERGHDGATVTLRLDTHAAETHRFSLSTTREALFFNPTLSYGTSYDDSNKLVAEFVRRLAASERLVFRFTPFNSDPATTTFRLDGLGEAVRPIEEASGFQEPLSCPPRTPP